MEYAASNADNDTLDEKRDAYSTIEADLADKRKDILEKRGVLEKQLGDLRKQRSGVTRYGIMIGNAFKKFVAENADLCKILNLRGSMRKFDPMSLQRNKAEAAIAEFERAFYVANQPNSSPQRVAGARIYFFALLIWLRGMFSAQYTANYFPPQEADEPTASTVFQERRWLQKINNKKVFRMAQFESLKEYQTVFNSSFYNPGIFSGSSFSDYTVATDEDLSISANDSELLKNKGIAALFYLMSQREQIIFKNLEDKKVKILSALLVDEDAAANQVLKMADACVELVRLTVLPRACLKMTFA